MTFLSNSKELMEKVINNPEAMDGSPELNIAHKNVSKRIRRIHTIFTKT